jgi:hypothetical protein
VFLTGLVSREEKRMPEANSNLRITAKIRPASKPGSVKAHADVRIDFAASTLEIFGLSIVRHDPDKPAWVSYPQRAGGKDSKKYFSIVKLTGVLHDTICAAVLQEFEQMPAKDHGGVPHAQIPREPGDEVPF